MPNLPDHGFSPIDVRDAARYRALVRATTEVVYRMSPDWTEMHVLEGRGFLADLSHPSTNWLDAYILPEDQRLVAIAITKAVTTQTLFDLEHRVRQRDGSIGWTHSRAVPILDDDGQITEWVGSATDITARKHVEAVLQERVSAATVDLRALSRRLLLVQEDERRRLALELHDEIGQVLTGLGFQLAAARGQNGAALAEATRTVQLLTEQVRQLALELRPQVLDRYGLFVAVQWYVERFEQRTGIAVSPRHDGPEQRYAPEVEIAAFRVVQEALTNIARHAEVHEASVEIVSNGVLLVVIQDEGRGFNPDVLRESSGLAGMRERVALLGGKFNLDTSAGNGVRIAAEFPLGVPNLESGQEAPA